MQGAILLTIVGGAIDTIGFIALLGFFTAHVTGNLVLAGGAFVKGGAGLWIKLGAIPLFIVTVIISKMLIDRNPQNRQTHQTLGWLFAAEAFFLLSFMIAGLYFEPFKDPNGADLALTGGLGLIGLGIRNTASKTLIKYISPSTMMTGNTTQLGIDLSNYLRARTPANARDLLKSASIVIGFVIGAFMGASLYVAIGFWSVFPFIIPVVYMARAAFRNEFR
ncbi:hypothetical protein AWV79_36415 [Cupriavidus sp. UYMMa02A]|nr:hypothetical protein AWV79_36415 [Cupriavidus sp. UYMMa02A]